MCVTQANTLAEFWHDDENTLNIQLYQSLADSLNVNRQILGTEVANAQ